jgi:hypothetical protein
MKSHTSVRWICGALAALACLAAAPVASAAAGAHGTKHKVGRGTSTNWSGYTVDGAGASSVVGSWIQPSATCSGRENSWSSPWVGIDGDTSNTVEQTGTDADCVSGKPYYYAWYEMYPKGTVVIPKITLTPGDSITGTVSYVKGSFVLTLTDNTTGASYSTTQQSSNAQRSSVEWIMEGPSKGLLTDFGSVSFSGASATIGAQTGALGSFATNPLTMVTGKGAARATPSTITGTNAFGVTWKHA